MMINFRLKTRSRLPDFVNTLREEEALGLVRLQKHLRKIQQLNPLVGGDLIDARVEHNPAEWATQGNSLRTSIHQLLRAAVARALVGGFFHPHSAAACAAAESLFAVVLRLDEVFLAD